MSTSAGGASTLMQVLELRIHGVNNTPPQDMLDLPAEAVESVAGDDLGSFWRRREQSPPPQAGYRGHAPSGVAREAYSWGGLARLSFSAGSGAFGALVGVVVRMLWTLLLPFALVNVGYWSRRLHYGKPGIPTKPKIPEFEPLRPGHAGGAWIFRLGGLALTLIMTVTAIVVSVDLVAVQCIPERANRTLCTAIPDAVGFLDGWSPGQRMAATSVIPVLLVLALYLLSSRTRVRFEQATRNQDPDQGSHGLFPTSATDLAPRWPLLSTPGFWNHSPVSAPAAAIHLAAALVLVVGLCCLHLWIRGASWTVLWVCLSVGALLLLVMAVRVQAGLDPLAADVATATTKPASRPTATGTPTPRAVSATFNATATGVLVVAAVILYSLFLIGAAAIDTWDATVLKDPQDPAAGALPMTVTHAALDVLVAFVVALIIVALSVRRDAVTPFGGKRRSLLQALLGLPFVAVVVILPSWPVSEWGIERWSVAGLPVGSWAGDHALICVTGALGLGAALSGWAYHRPATLPGSSSDHGVELDERGNTGWGGRAPGVFLGLGLVFCLLLTSALTLTIGDRLNANNSAGSLMALPTAPAAAQAAVDLVVPSLYGWFALDAVGGLIAMLLTIGLVHLSRWRGKEDPGPVSSSVASPPNATSRPLPGGVRLARIPESPVASRISRARRQARLAHRAEPLLGLLLISLAGTTLLISGLRQYPPTANNPYWSNFVTAAALILTVVTIAAITGGGTTASDRSGRPIGVLWDMACAVPRAAHPLGPPCYGERVIPEVLARCQWWLMGEGNQTTAPAPPRSVVLSAHSLGGVISVAAILGAPRPVGVNDSTLDTPDYRYGSWMVPRIALITYGTQLRAYFGRFFPELFGPEILGVNPAPGAKLFEPDPWSSDWADRPEDLKTPDPPRPGSVRHLLSLKPDAPHGSVRWYSLWHLTDYLGFPVVARPTRDLTDSADLKWGKLNDAYADEVDYTAYLLTVLTHSDYPRTAAYDAALTSAILALRR
jgi:hypothetical protein